MLVLGQTTKTGGAKNVLKIKPKYPVKTLGTGTQDRGGAGSKLSKGEKGGGLLREDQWSGISRKRTTDDVNQDTVIEGGEEGGKWRSFGKERRDRQTRKKRKP